MNTQPNISGLTPRWFQIPDHVRKHPVQMQLLDDFKNKRFLEYYIAAGRRSYKTERFGKRLIVTEALNNDNHIYYAGAPTRGQAKEILWKDIKALCPKHLVERINESTLKITLINKTEITVVGLKEFKRIQGGRCHGFLFTEWQDCDPDAFNESVEPMLNDTGGWSIKEGRPFGKNHFFDEFNEGKKRKPGKSASYHWKSEDVLTPEQIERAKSRLAKADYEREYEASFDTGNLSPYYAYSTMNNRKFEVLYELPFIVACDFNATEKPMSWVIGQRYYDPQKKCDIVQWHKALSFQYTNTLTMCQYLDEDYFQKLRQYPKKVIFYGDYSGKKQTSNSSYSDWEIIENYFRNKTQYDSKRKYCKSIRDSVAATNAQLCNVKNEVRQYVDAENCEALIKDWEHCTWKENGRELEEKDPLRTHCCRAVDYFNDYENPVRVNSKSTSFRTT